jgi:RimK family alpha-L-glutamate ligase
MGEDSVYTPLKYYLINWYQKHKAKVLNLESFQKWPSMDKIIQYLVLREAGLPIVKSRVFGSKKALSAWAKSHGFPFIVKFNIGSCGWDVFKITSLRALNKLLKSDYNIKTLIVQEFLKTGEDIRVIVLGGRVLGAMRRTAALGQFLTNYSQGASVSSYDISKDKAAYKLALSAAKAARVDYAGVDLMRDNKGRWVILEINRACQFEGFEKATGVNVAQKVIRFLS